MRGLDPPGAKALRRGGNNTENYPVAATLGFDGTTFIALAP